MYAQVAAGYALPGRRSELERLIREQLLPAFREEDGFCGALHLVNGESDATMMLVCWETEAQATRTYGEYRERSRAALAAMAAISSEFTGQSSVWEIDARA